MTAQIEMRTARGEARFDIYEGKLMQTYYSGSRLSEVQEPHPQPPPRKRGGDYDVPHVIRKRYIDGTEVIIPVHVEDDIPDTIIGSLWLDIMQLVVNKPKGILTLEMVNSN
ncbi:hypothetical protein [Nostoc sp.]|uniref:hypothetical protein n=1 Tax=Nostoc sp. TaxID=1180 RepID=UPI002FFB78C1